MQRATSEASQVGTPSPADPWRITPNHFSRDNIGDIHQLRNRTRTKRGHRRSRPGLTRTGAVAYGDWGGNDVGERGPVRVSAITDSGLFARLLSGGVDLMDVLNRCPESVTGYFGHRCGSGRRAGSRGSTNADRRFMHLTHAGHRCATRMAVYAEAWQMVRGFPATKP